MKLLKVEFSKIELAIIAALLLFICSCKTTKTGCDYNRGRYKKFTSDIQTDAELIRVASHKLGFALLVLKAPNYDTIYCRYRYRTSPTGKMMKFVKGSKYHLSWNSKDTCNLRVTDIKRIS
jgi:hypothetical protein